MANTMMLKDFHTSGGNGKRTTLISGAMFFVSKVNRESILDKYVGTKETHWASTIDYDIN
jgi:hypothetical protein